MASPRSELSERFEAIRTTSSGPTRDNGDAPGQRYRLLTISAGLRPGRSLNLADLVETATQGLLHPSPRLNCRLRTSP